jgi:hypothetical protein
VGETITNGPERSENAKAERRKLVIDAKSFRNADVGKLKDKMYKRPRKLPIRMNAEGS